MHFQSYESVLPNPQVKSISVSPLNSSSSQVPTHGTEGRYQRQPPFPGAGCRSSGLALPSPINVSGSGGREDGCNLGAGGWRPQPHPSIFRPYFQDDRERTGRHRVLVGGRRLIRHQAGKSTRAL